MSASLQSSDLSPAREGSKLDLAGMPVPPPRVIQERAVAGWLQSQRWWPGSRAGTGQGMQVATCPGLLGHGCLVSREPPCLREAWAPGLPRRGWDTEVDVLSTWPWGAQAGCHVPREYRGRRPRACRAHPQGLAAAVTFREQHQSWHLSRHLLGPLPPGSEPPRRNLSVYTTRCGFLKTSSGQPDEHWISGSTSV